MWWGCLDKIDNSNSSYPPRWSVGHVPSTSLEFACEMPGLPWHVANVDQGGFGRFDLLSQLPECTFIESLKGSFWQVKNGGNCLYCAPKDCLLWIGPYTIIFMYADQVYGTFYSNELQWLYVFCWPMPILHCCTYVWGMFMGWICILKAFERPRWGKDNIQNVLLCVITVKLLTHAL